MCDVPGLMALCSDDVEWSGLLVRKVTGDPSGTLQGKEATRRFVEKLVSQGGAFTVTLNRLGIGIRSVVLDVSFEGIIPGFTTLVVNPQRQITQVLMHQELL